MLPSQLSALALGYDIAPAVVGRYIEHNVRIILVQEGELGRQYRRQQTAALSALVEVLRS